MTAAIVAAATGSAAAQQVVINEFVAAPRYAFTQEQIELYNSTSEPINIGGLWIDDAVGGGSPRRIPSDTVIQPYGFFVWTDNGLLNNDRDDVRLLSADQTEVLDIYTYTRPPGYDASYRRRHDAGPWAFSSTTDTTIGWSNGSSQGSWTPGTFEIHVFNVGQGDSQLIVSPDGRTLLIDVAELGTQSDQGARIVGDKIRDVMGSYFSHIDYLMVSHWHLDHIGTARVGGVWKLIEHFGFTVGKLIDRNGATWVDDDANGECGSDEIRWHNIGEVSGTMTSWVCYATDPANTHLNREVAVLGSSDQIVLGPQVQVQIVAVDGIPEIQGDQRADQWSENDYSVGAKVTFGRVTYVTAGDASGYRQFRTHDVETPIAARIGGPIELLHVNHHGSRHSSNDSYLDMLRPQAALMSCGYHNQYGHPPQETLDRLLLPLRGITLFLPNVCAEGDYYGERTRFANGPIVVRSTDGQNYTVHDRGFTAR